MTKLLHPPVFRMKKSRTHQVPVRSEDCTQTHPRAATPMNCASMWFCARPRSGSARLIWSGASKSAHALSACQDGRLKTATMTTTEVAAVWPPLSTRNGDWSKISGASHVNVGIVFFDKWHLKTGDKRLAVSSLSAFLSPTGDLISPGQAPVRRSAFDVGGNIGAPSGSRFQKYHFPSPRGEGRDDEGTFGIFHPPNHSLFTCLLPASENLQGQKRCYS